MSTPDRYGCEEAFRRLDDYVDRELSADEIRLVGKHLETCATCAAEFTFEDRVIACVRRKVQRISMPKDLMTRISAKLSEGEDSSSSA